MNNNQYSLLFKRRFSPMFGTQFMGAFNDNVYKNALIVLTTYVLAVTVTEEINWLFGFNLSQNKVSQMLVATCNLVFVLPMALFSAFAGQLADKFEKSYLIRKIKLAEIVIMSWGCVALYLRSFWLLLTVLFFMGAQSAFFGPLKYSILPQHLKKDELIGGNALFEAATFIAILGGSLLGALLILQTNGILVISGVVILLAIIGYSFSMFIPKAESVHPELKLDIHIVKCAINVASYCLKDKKILLPILGVSWFWFLGSMFLNIFPNYCKDTLGADQNVLVIFFMCFSIGIGVGSLMCNVLLRGEIKTTFVPISLILMGLLCADLYMIDYSLIIPDPNNLIGPVEFLSSTRNLRILADLSLISVFSGIYIVPIHALMQQRSEPAYRARVIACNNIVNASFIMLSSMIIIFLSMAGFKPVEFFKIGMLTNLILAAVIYFFNLNK